MQLIKYDLFQNSTDEVVKELMAIRASREEKLTRVWKPTTLSKIINTEVDLDLKFPLQSSKIGLGHGNFNPNPSLSERRKMITSKAMLFSEQERVAHSTSLSQQGVWLQWADNALPFDFSWSNMIWGSNYHIVKFVLNASINWVATPHLLKLWGLKENGCCTLCAEPKCTLHHIISHCQFSLQSKRYTWRHDSVLLSIKQAMEEHLSAVNKESAKCPNLQPSLSELFVRAGQFPLKKKITPKPKNELEGASDWKILVDFDQQNIIFPPEICESIERPDIIIWSSSLKKVILMELTCPAEEGILAARAFKEAKYLPLVNSIKANHWKSIFLSIEVGARGFVSHSFVSSLFRLGISRSLINSLRKTVSTIAAKCSFHIFQSANSKAWDVNKALLVPN